MKLLLTKEEVESVQKKAQADILTQKLPFDVRIAVLELATACLKVRTMIELMEEKNGG